MEKGERGKGSNSKVDRDVPDERGSGRPVARAPDGHHTVNPWVIPKGARDFIRFLEEVFEAEEKKEARIPDEDGLLSHAEVVIGDSVIGIFDSKLDWPRTPGFLQVYVNAADAVLKRAKLAGAQVVTYELH